MIPFPNKKYNIIYADPPWKFKNKNTGGSMSSGSINKYKIMTLQEIKSLPIPDICEEDCFLFMWWVASMPTEAIEVVKSWGFNLKTMTGFSWLKKTKHYKDHFGMGFYTRQQQEHCLIATRGKPKVESHSVRQNVTAVVKKHSQKPIQTYRRIEELCGKLPRVELFARNYKEGWDSWGDELD